MTISEREKVKEQESGEGKHFFGKKGKTLQVEASWQGARCFVPARAGKASDMAL